MNIDYDKDPRPVALTPEAMQKLRSVATATLAGQLQQRGILNGFLVGILRPTLIILGLMGETLPASFEHVVEALLVFADFLCLGFRGLIFTI